MERLREYKRVLTLRDASYGIQDGTDSVWCVVGNTRECVNSVCCALDNTSVR